MNNKPLTLGFDVYGTLIDTQGVSAALHPMIGADAAKFLSLWREKQLEYTYRRSLMDCYENFATCTRDALIYTVKFMNCDLTPAQIQHLLAAYATLPAFQDVESSLILIRARGHKMVAFSNGGGAQVEALLHHAGIGEYFHGIVSVDEIGIFKPSPKTYQHFLAATRDNYADNDASKEAHKEQAWLISSNSFDIIGALACGMKAAWIQRCKTVVFDPWEGYSPTLTLNSIAQLPEALTPSQSR